MDALVVMGDRILILELKDLQGSLTPNGDQWINGRNRFHSPVQTMSMKARKLKTFLVRNIPGFRYYVDFRVVLTGAATKANLSAEEKKHVLSLAEAVSLSTQAGRDAILNRTTLHHQKAFELEPDFERITGNPRMFGPLEAEWDGYRVVEEDFVVHPDRIWHEHRAEQLNDPRYKALLRIWRFDKLPVGLNSPDRRAFIAGRELRAIGRLHALGSTLVERNSILAPIGEEKDQFLTQHYELRRLTLGFTTLDRFLERASEDLNLDDRVTAAGSLLDIMAELHAQGIAHRDIGPRSVWASSPTRVALAGLMTCQLPDEESLEDWSSLLRGHAKDLPEDSDKALAGTAKQRDVFSAAHLVRRILTGQANATTFPPDLPEFTNWFAAATAREARARPANGRILADSFASLIERSRSIVVDQTLLDRYETPDNPYFVWPLAKRLKGNSVYISQGEGSEIVVKTWPRIRRGTNAACDLAMTRLFSGVGRLIASPIPGLPSYIKTGLSDTGPFVVYRFVDGTLLNEIDINDAEAALSISSKLVQCIAAIHAMGIAHGDVAKKNILIHGEEQDVTVLDLFDMSEVGSGRIRTPSMAPENYDALTEEQLDRYAVVKIVNDLLSPFADQIFSDVIATVTEELARPRIETLEPLSLTLRGALLRIEAARPPQISLSFRGAGAAPFTSDNGQYYLHVDKADASSLEYKIFGVDRELVIQLRAGEINRVRYIPANFTGLSLASQFGVPLRLQIDLTEGDDVGFEDFLSVLRAAAGTQLTEGDDREEAPTGSIDVPRYWRKLLDLEAAFQPEVEILQYVGSTGHGTAVYEYERLGQDFDFDAGTTVEAKLPNGRKIGEVNLEQTDAQKLVIEYADKRLEPGDRVQLVDRRSRSSFDRRLKAIDRILDNEAAIDGLIEYFETDRNLQANDFQQEASDSTLKKYGLNRGQRNAFRHVIRYGPVGLLQGPPGTGKTHFIASLVHWLITEKGARKILIASQSHEAVNNAIEALLKLYKKIGGERPNLLRIGSKGITDKIRPYHTVSIQERFQARFENAFVHRVSGLASAMGLRRAFVSDAIEIDRDLGSRVRRLNLLADAERYQTRSSAERAQRDSFFRTAVSAFAAAAEKILGRPANAAKANEELDVAFGTLLERYPEASPSDLTRVRQLIELSREWSTSLASPYRNFEEFLAKTRSVVTATCVGVGQTKIRVEKSTYDWVIVDEAARCTPGELAVPIQLGRRVLLVGDHRQLLPMTERGVSNALRQQMPDTPKSEFDRSDFERAYLSSYGQANGRTLTEQYRMAPAICDLVSKIFYEPEGIKLITSDDREADSAFDREFKQSLNSAATWIDTYKERNHVEKPADWDETTFYNQAEAETILRLLEVIAADTDLVEALANGKEEFPIGVICMYSAQKTLIERDFSRRPWEARFRNMVRIDTVDSYQGKENSIVIVSLVRCNDKGDQGHVRIPNRCNVAISRAKERLFIVGASSMWRSVPKRSPMHKVLSEIETKSPGYDIFLAETLR
jgi:serine/threonine protein kinase